MADIVERLQETPYLPNAVKVLVPESAEDLIFRFRRERKEAAAEIERLRAAGRSLLAHWDEFGPEHGFDETVHSVRNVFTSGEGVKS